MRGDEHLSNPFLECWGLLGIREKLLDEGVFFKAGTSRPVKNFFSPPFGGIPLTTKKSKVEETVFMFHDLGHHLIPDLLFDGEDSPEARIVYSAWRMMSEAMTLILADMLYANTLVRSKSENEQHVDTRIYPLFKALDIEEGIESNRQELTIHLLWANVQYAVLGDDSEWRKLLKPGEESKLEAYKKHFEKFFVGDHVWTHANYRNRVALKESYKDWISLSGEKMLKKANLFLLSDVIKRLKGNGASLSSFQEAVPFVFLEIISERIFPEIDIWSTGIISEEERLSRGFRRYMIGLLSFYTRYQGVLDGLALRGQKLREAMESQEYFSPELRETLYQQYVNDVRYAWGMGCITTAAAANFSQVHPIFPPVYINYSKQECKTVREVVAKLYDL